jgi:short-subunit dehydrogenase
MKFQGKTVLITGASSGIGMGFALRVAKDGGTVLLAARREDKLKVVKAKVEELGGKAEIFPTDVTDLKQVKELFIKATEGGRTIDLVFNNAGIGFVGNIYDLPAEEIVSVLDVNVRGMILVAKYASEVMTRQNSGHIIFCSSLAGLITMPQWSVYVASKWAITGFADSIRPELKKFNIKITTLHPGAVLTEFFDPKKADIDISKMGKALTIEDVAEYLYAASFTNRRRIVIPGSSQMFSSVYRFFPRMAEKMVLNMAKDVQYTQREGEDEPDFSFIKSSKEE